MVVTIISAPRANGSYQAPIKAGGEEIAAGGKRSPKTRLRVLSRLLTCGNPPDLPEIRLQLWAEPFLRYQ